MSSTVPNEVDYSVVELRDKSWRWRESVKDVASVGGKVGVGIENAGLEGESKSTSIVELFLDGRKESEVDGVGVAAVRVRETYPFSDVNGREVLGVWEEKWIVGREVEAKLK